MNYPNKIKKQQSTIIYSNRGMSLENMINETNKYYLDEDKALIYKKPTPIGIVDVSYENHQKIIKKAYFQTQSTLDYNGIYKGKYLDFEAKETKNRTSFPLENIHSHQIKHIDSVIRHGGISFLLILINNLVYLLKGEDFINFVNNNKRKSIPYSYIKEKGFLVKYNYLPVLDYLKIVDEIYNIKEINNEKEN